MNLLRNNQIFSLTLELHYLFYGIEYCQRQLIHSKPKQVYPVIDSGVPGTYHHADVINQKGETW